MTDLEIQMTKTLDSIEQVGSKLGITRDEMIFYGNDKAKIKKQISSNDEKLILVTAISPTPYGEGKTTVSIGLADAFSLLHKKVSLSLRQPSLGPVFGMKGGATGGGYSQVAPMCDINLHFTGDFHAITAANNLISAAIFNHIEQGNELGFATVVFQRCLDVNDRSLRHISFTCHNEEYQDQFNITAASEIMALFCLAKDISDLKMRLSKIVVGYTSSFKMITVHDLRLEGALLVLLKDAFLPNLVQTLEKTPAFIHGGPFANIAHGCSSVQATKLSLAISDYTITEAGFGADLGAEKFLNLVCPMAQFHPAAMVLVVTIRALYHHGNGDLKEGISNLKAHIDHLLCYHVPIVVCINRFSEDREDDIQYVIDYCRKMHLAVEVSCAYEQGGQGAIALAKTVLQATDEKNAFQPLLTSSMDLVEKLTILSQKVYHASTIEFSACAKEKLEILVKNNLDHLPVCVAKTQYSISDDAKKLGYPMTDVLHVSDIKLYRGAGFITVFLGKQLAMPGLPKHPNYEKIDYIDQKVIGIF